MCKDTNVNTQNAPEDIWLELLLSSIPLNSTIQGQKRALDRNFSSLTGV
jgi:hypothetical protein